MQPIHTRPTTPAFVDRGLKGYQFGPLSGDYDIHFVDVLKGHDTFQISKRLKRLYYILSGKGYFTIAGQRFDVSAGLLVEIPPRVEYTYSGVMKLLMITSPRWFRGNEIATRWNPDVLGQDVPFSRERSAPHLLARAKLFGKSPVNAFLRTNQQVWNRLPACVRGLAPARWYARWLHNLACIQNPRKQAPATFFLRNRPLLELMRRLVEHRTSPEPLRVAVLGCSTGAEAYSVAWTIQSARPDITLQLRGLDISSEAVEQATRGVYSCAVSSFTRTPVLERMTAAEIDSIFDRKGDQMYVKPWLRRGMMWSVGDAGDPAVAEDLGSQEIVVANNFLCHMDPEQAAKCLRNFSRVVAPGGYLFVSGVDLEVRQRVALELGWKPIPELLAEIHEGDPILRKQWPCHYSGLEPMDTSRSDWRLRYATVFQRPERSSAATEAAHRPQAERLGACAL